MFTNYICHTCMYFRSEINEKPGFRCFSPFIRFRTIRSPTEGREREVVVCRLSAATFPPSSFVFCCLLFIKNVKCNLITLEIRQWSYFCQAQRHQAKVSKSGDFSKHKNTLSKVGDRWRTSVILQTTHVRFEMENSLRDPGGFYSRHMLVCAPPFPNTAFLV